MEFSTSGLIFMVASWAAIIGAAIIGLCIFCFAKVFKKK